jgi:hypothetical protein
MTSLRLTSKKLGAAVAPSWFVQSFDEAGLTAGAAVFVFGQQPCITQVKFVFQLAEQFVADAALFAKLNSGVSFDAQQFIPK